MEDILLIDDDVELCHMLTEYLARYDLHVTAVHRGDTGLDAARSRPWPMILLDVMLPGIDGFEVLTRLRSTSSDSVLLLTARGEDVDRIVGLEIGADDYLAKPFNPRELVARINAIMRRQNTPPEKKLRFGRYQLDLHERTLTAAGVAIDLTTAEFDLLRVLATHPRQPLSRDILMQLARGRDHTPFDRSIDVRISRLRRILEEDPAHPRYIQTLWGFGYVFNPGDPE